MLAGFTGYLIVDGYRVYQRLADKLGPGVVQNWTNDVRSAVAFGQTHNRHRDWHEGSHPGYTHPGPLAGRLR